MTGEPNEHPRVGTQVVISEPEAERGNGRGSVGRVLRDRGTSLTVALTDGRVVSVVPERITPVRAVVDAGTPTASVDDATLVADHTVYAAVVGPAALGLGGDGITPDVRAVFQSPTSAFWALTKPPTQIDGPTDGWRSWEVEQFCRRALEADPEALELLWSSRPVWSSETGLELLDLRGAFLSRLLAPAYSSYVAARFKALDDAEPDQSERRWAHATHLLHLLMDGAALTRRGATTDLTPESRHRLIGIRAGQQSWSAVDTWRLELQKELEQAAATTFLPAVPDTARVDAWLIRARQRDVDRQARASLGGQTQASVDGPGDELVEGRASGYLNGPSEPAAT